MRIVPPSRALELFVLAMDIAEFLCTQAMGGNMLQLPDSAFAISRPINNADLKRPGVGEKAKSFHKGYLLSVKSLSFHLIW